MRKQMQLCLLQHARLPAFPQPTPDHLGNPAYVSDPLLGVMQFYFISLLTYFY